jgi:cytoskeletal protein CcmA (bactofilin family)
VIGVGVTVTGKITSPGFVQIDGHVQGEVRANTLVINATAFIQGGDVFADPILVRGKITGNVRGREDIARHCSCGRNDLPQAPGGRHGRHFSKGRPVLGKPNG